MVSQPESGDVLCVLQGPGWYNRLAQWFDEPLPRSICFDGVTYHVRVATGPADFSEGSRECELVGGRYDNQAMSFNNERRPVVIRIDNHMYGLLTDFPRTKYRYVRKQ